MFKSLTVRSNNNFSSFINYFLVSKLFLGYYFDISKSKVYNRIIRFYCVTISSLAIAVAVKGFSDRRKTFYLSSCTVTSLYIFEITACHFHNQKYFFKFCSTLKAIDSSVGSKTYIKSHVPKFVVLFIHLLCFTYIIAAGSELGFRLHIILYFLFEMSSCLQYVMITLIFDLLRQRKILLTKYAKNLEDHDVNDDEKLRLLKKILFSHKNLLTNLKQNTKFAKPMVIKLWVI